MALFKIFKGSKDNLGQAPETGLQDTRQTHEGFAYFTPEDGKFYIDIADSNSAVVGTNRIPISADKADKDASGNIITSTYLTKAAGVTNVAWNSTNKKLTKTINGSTTDVVTIGTIKTALALAKSDVGLGNVANIDQSKAIKSITRSGTTFTYTCLDDTTGTFTQRDNNSATAVDNILDGSNSGTAITYAPYATQQSKLSFDTSTDFPTKTDRLNLNGILYATKFQTEHISGGQNEYRVTYGSSVDMSMMIGTGNENHGLYDNIAKKWMIVADDSGNVTVNGTATNVAWSGVTGKPSTFTPSSHTHGNITNAGAITATQTIANGDKIVIVDSSDSSKITGTTITFDGSTATKALTQKGTWETFNNYSLPTASSSTLGGIKIGTGLNINSGVVSVNIADLGLSSAMHFIGIAKDVIEDGQTTNPTIAGMSSYTPQAGDVVLAKDSASGDSNKKAEFVYVKIGTNTGWWELLGDEGSYALISQIPTKSSWNYDDVYVKYSASQSLTAAQKTQARSNIGAGTVTSVQIAATSPIESSISTASSTILSTTISLANEYGDKKNPYGSKTKSYVLAAPSSANGAPDFRALVAADIPNLAWSKITSGNDDLKAIENLTGTSGFLKKTAANTWTLDTNTYVTSSGVTKITAGTGLNTSADQADSATKGNITTTGTLHLTTSGVTAGTKGPTANVTGTEGNTIKVPKITVDKYGRVTALEEYTYTSKNTTYTFTAGTSTLSWGTEVTLATVGGLAIKAKLPSNPDTNTDTKVKVATNTTTKAYLIGATANGYNSGTAIEAIADTGVYLDTTASQLTSKSFAWHVESTAKAYTSYDTADDSINFNFI